jgi:hypothetical protein
MENLVTSQTSEGGHCDNHINTILSVFKRSTKDTQMDTHTKFIVYLGSADG